MPVFASNGLIGPLPRANPQPSPGPALSTCGKKVRKIHRNRTGREIVLNLLITKKLV